MKERGKFFKNSLLSPRIKIGRLMTGAESVSVSDEPVSVFNIGGYELLLPLLSNC